MMFPDNKEVTAMIEKLPSPQKEICIQVRTMIRTAFPEIEEKWRWSRPVYAVGDRYVCYMVANKNDINFGFEHGVKLSDPRGLFGGTGAQMRHIKIHHLQEVDIDYYKTLVAQAIAIAPTI